MIGDPSGGRGDGPRHVRRDGDGTDDGTGGKRTRSWPQRLVLTVGIVIVVFCLLGGAVGGYFLVKYESIDRVGGLDIAPAAAGEPQNYLIVAVDTREGQGSKNTDTIMVVRIDPGSDRLALTSFPRDLMVTIADTGETGMINSAFARDAGGEQNLIDTLKQNFDITINHYVQVNFESFRQVVDSIGGVPVWMPSAARDSASGFYNDQLGCVTLNGEQGLAFVRSRKMEVMVGEDDWERDPLSDVNRVKRQQIFIQRAMTDALSEVKSNPLRLRELVDIGVSNVSLDPNLGIGDILDLADHFKGFDASKLEAYPLPVVDYPPDPNRLLLDEAGAEEMLNVFRGLAPGEIRPGLINGQGAERHGRRSGPAARGPRHRRQRGPAAGGLRHAGARRRRDLLPADHHRVRPRPAGVRAAAGPPHHQRRGHPDGREPRPRGGERAADRRPRLRDGPPGRHPDRGDAGGPRRRTGRTRGRRRGARGPGRHAGDPAADDTGAPEPVRHRRDARGRHLLSLVLAPPATGLHEGMVGSGARRWQDARRRSRRGVTMDDAEVIRRIGALVDEEHELERTQGASGPDEEAEGRLREIDVALDQCWDLLRQRRARREMGDDPDDAAVRPPEIVERYQQ